MTWETKSPGPLLQQPRQAPAGGGERRAAAAVPDDLHALRAVVEGTAAGTGREFFRSLVRHLAEAIDVHFAAVSEFLAPPRGLALAVWDRDRIVEDLEFDFTASPAGHVLSSDLVHFPTGVLRHFPHVTRLVERDAAGYMAVPVVDSQGHVLGSLSVYDERPMPAEPRRLFILRIFAARAAAEFERLRAEQRLSESEARYRDLFENAPGAYWVVGLDGRIQSANRRVSELMGYPLSEIVGQEACSFTTDARDGRPKSQELKRQHEAGEPVSGREIEVRHKDGRPVWLEVWKVPTRGADGSIQTTRCFCMDITDRVLAEQERDRLQRQKLYLQEEIKADHNFEQIIGHCPALTEVLEQVNRVAPTDATVLVTGETGTGKELKIGRASCRARVWR